MKLIPNFSLLFVILLFASCEMLVTPEVETVSISATKTRINVSDTTTLLGSVYPSEAPQGLKWSSSDATVATVSETGIVTAVSPGIVVITAEGGSKSATQKLYIGYENDFTNPGNWYVGTSYGRTSEITGGKLNITITDEGDGYVFPNHAYYPTLVNGSKDVKIKAPYEIKVDNVIDQSTQTNGIIAVGIKFNYVYTDNSNYSYDYAAITGNGKFTVKSYNKVGDKWTTHQNYTVNTAIKVNSTVNSLKLVQSATKMTFYVNNAILCDLAINAPASECGVGLISSEASNSESFTVSTSYDNFSVYPLD